MAIETGLPPRYEIRVLGPEHADWARAIVSHSNTFYSPVWSPLYPDNQTARCYGMFEKAEYLVDHQIKSGLSLGVFDREYKFKRPESAEAPGGGKLYWDVTDETPDKDQLLEQMDFPLASVALAYDSINALDMSKLSDIISYLPEFGIVYKVLGELDKRDPASWTATGPGQVLFRNATSTRAEYEGEKLMKLQAQYMMRKSAEEGFRGIQIECAHPAVTSVWSNPPAPFKGEIVAQFNTLTHEEVSEQGEKSHPFKPADVNLTKVYVTLKE
ncbi:hypothetical protein BX600DRAFT_428754 [Xylariales sp. PMI_506]|nr:hypothetical protein BX600DRAFT_428754 [Xylariales sp. PMI_506]